MRESRTYGSVRGAGSNLRPYRDPSVGIRPERQLSGDKLPSMPVQSHKPIRPDSSVMGPPGAATIGHAAAASCCVAECARARLEKRNLRLSREHEHSKAALNLDNRRTREGAVRD